MNLILDIISKVANKLENKHFDSFVEVVEKFLPDKKEQALTD